MGTVPEAERAAPIRVLLIDDDEDDRFLTEERLGDVPGRPYTLDWTPHYADGLQAIRAGSHDVYLLDFRLGEKTGIEMLREARDGGRGAPIILFTGQAHNETDLEALAAGADDYLEKAGLTSALLDRSIRYALAQSHAAAELELKVRARTEELAHANAALLEVDRRKDEFLATLAHELRNPLAPILNALEILRLANDSGDTVRRQRERMERQVAQLKRLVEDLLDVSRITTGKMRLTLEPLTVQDVMESVIDMSRSQFEKAGLEFVVDVPAEPIRLAGDRVRLTQAFCNVLNNAAKFTEPGGKVWLTVRPVGGRVTVSVRDTGVGIPAAVLPQLFALFTQVDRTLNRSQAGLGIGLALVRRLVEMHGGTVTARSDGPGTGAQFDIHLPVTRSL